MSLKLRCVDTTAGSLVLHRVVQVEHLVKHHIFQRQTWHIRMIENPADHDHVVRRIIVPQAGPRTHVTPAQSWPRH